MTVSGDEIAQLLGWEWALKLPDRDAPTNLARRLALSMRHLIVTGLLPNGTRLPPERALAASIGVSRPTITAALDDLRRLGLIAAKQGSGTWVEHAENPPSPFPAMADMVFTDHGINLAAATAQDAAHLGPINLTLSDLLATSPAHGYDPRGLPELRQRVAEHISRDGVAANPDDIIITNGAHHALSLILGALVKPNDLIAAEEYTYGGLLDLAHTHRARVDIISRDSGGTVVGSLRQLLRRSKPKLVFLMPRVHGPTGTTTDPNRHTELTAELMAAGSVVIEDDTLADLILTDNHGRLPAAPGAVRIGSLSKSVWGGLRLGWIHSPAPMRDQLLRHRARTDLGTPIASQIVGLQVIDGLATLLNRRTAELRARAEHLQQLVTAALPDWQATTPHGGLSLWVRLPLRDASTFTTMAARSGVLVMPGTVARPDRNADPHIRICFDRNPNIVEEGVERLAETWTRLLQTVRSGEVKFEHGGHAENGKSS